MSIYILNLLILFLIIFCIYYFIQRKKKIDFFDNKILSQKKFDSFILKNSEKKAFNIGLKDIRIQRDECFKKCDAENCMKLYMKRLNYNKCKECQNKGMCYNNLYTMGACDYCGKNLKKLNCNHKNNIGCTDPNNIFNLEGIEPYYIEVPSNNSNSPFDSKCVFCWQLESYI